MKKIISLVIALIMALSVLAAFSGCQKSFLDTIKDLPNEEQATAIYEKAMSDESSCKTEMTMSFDANASGNKIEMRFDAELLTYAAPDGAVYTKEHDKSVVSTARSEKTDEYTEGYIDGRMFIDRGEGKRFYSEIGYEEYKLWSKQRAEDVDKVLSSVTNENCKMRSAVIGEDGCCEVTLGDFDDDFICSLGYALSMNVLSALVDCDFTDAVITIKTDDKIRPVDIDIALEFTTDSDSKGNELNASMSLRFSDYDAVTAPVIDDVDTYKKVDDLRAYYDASDFTGKVFASEEKHLTFSDSTVLSGDLQYSVVEDGTIDYSGLKDDFEFDISMNLNSEPMRITYKKGKLSTIAGGKTQSQDMTVREAKTMMMSYSAMFLFDLDDFTDIIIGSADHRKTVEFKLSDADRSKFEALLTSTGYKYTMGSLMTTSLVFTYNEDGSEIEKVDFSMNTDSTVAGTYHVSYDYSCSVAYAK